MTRKRKSTALQPDVPGLPEKEPAIDSQKVQRRKKVQLILAPGTPDQNALRSVVREWLVPMLVREFLAERGIAPPEVKNKVISSKLSTGPLARSTRHAPA